MILRTPCSFDSQKRDHHPFVSSSYGHVPERPMKPCFDDDARLRDACTISTSSTVVPDKASSVEANASAASDSGRTTVIHVPAALKIPSLSDDEDTIDVPMARSITSAFDLPVATSNEQQLAELHAESPAVAHLRNLETAWQEIHKRQAYLDVLDCYCSAGEYTSSARLSNAPCLAA